MSIIALYIPTGKTETISLVNWETKQYQTDIRGNLVYQFLELQDEPQPIEAPQARGLTPQASPAPKKKKGGCNCKK